MADTVKTKDAAKMDCPYMEKKCSTTSCMAFKTFNEMKTVGFCRRIEDGLALSGGLYAIAESLEKQYVELLISKNSEMSVNS